MVNTSSEHDRAVQKLLEDARRKLVETGTRNRLIHVNRANRRANALNVINERADDIYRLVRLKSRKMGFIATAEDEAEDGSPQLKRRPETIVAESRYVDSFLETPLSEDKLQKRLRALARNAKTVEEEQGVNVLYLALGFLTWFESPSSKVARTAPLVLLPVELVRNPRTSCYELVSRDDDLVTNLPLQERLKNDFGLELPEIDENETWSPSHYFERVNASVGEAQGWSVEPNAMQIGFFSFAKLLMMRDLEPANWPEKTLEQHALVHSLLMGGFERTAATFREGDRLDDVLSPGDLIQVVDADASQTKVIETVRRGKSLVVQGPPGTGKSQTIANIIAGAVYDGKTVLFVAEKMAALSVVSERLAKVGLRDICLELHSRKANKKAVLNELARTLNSGGAAARSPVAPTALKDARDQLNAASALLHTQLPQRDYTAFDALSQLIGFIGKGIRPPSVPRESYAAISNARAAQLCEMVRKLGVTATAAGKPSAHPFYGTRNLNLQPPDQQRLAAQLTTLSATIDRLLDQSTSVATVLRTGVNTLAEVKAAHQFLGSLESAPPLAAALAPAVMGADFDRARLAAALGFLVEWRESKRAVAGTFVDIAAGADVRSLRAALALGTSTPQL